MAMAIRERTTEISVLRALGFTEGRVLSLVLAEGMVLSGLGGALGLGLTWFVAFGVRAAMGDIFPWFQDFALAPRTILICGGGAVLVGLLSSFLPAYQAVRRPIVEGLRTL
jgi:putative ABC transport system permease protein